jgi:hypothetical protein
MEDLLENFSKHINKVISSKLGSKIRNLARATTNYRTDEDYSRMESNIQMLIESYLSNLKDNEYKEIANNIFNSFVEEDDKNLIKAVNFFKRTYEYYQELNLRKKFFKWRKTSLKLKMINNLVSKEMKSKKENNNNIINKNKMQLNEIRYNDNDNNDDREENNNYNINMDEEFWKNNNNINKGNNFENVEEFIKNGNNNQSYKFNYGEYMDNNEDFKEEFNEELDVNKLYSKKKYNN